MTKKKLAPDLDLAFFMTWLLEKYPNSVDKLDKNPEFVSEFAGINYRLTEKQAVEDVS